MVAIAKLHEEPERFFLSYKSWFMPVVAFIGSVWIMGFGVFFAYKEYTEGVFGWSVYVLCSVFILFGLLLFSSLFCGANGRRGKEFNGYLLWGAGKDGLFMLSPEVKLTSYDWSRVSKIVVIDKIKYPENSAQVIEGIWGLSDLATMTSGNVSQTSKVILFYVDRMNPLVNKITKKFHEPSMRYVKAISKSYKPLDTARVIHLLSKYAPKDIIIERKSELNLSKTSV